MSAQQILNEALNEMERIKASKTSINEDLNNTLKDIRLRYQNKQKLKEFIEGERNKVMFIQSEVRGIDREIRNEMETNEKLLNKKSKSQ